MFGWVGVAALVVAYDAYALVTKKQPTMSASYKHGLEKRRVFTMGVTLALVAHLHENDLKKLMGGRYV